MFLWASRPPSDWTPLTCQACWGDMEPAGSLPAFFRGFWSLGDHVWCLAKRVLICDTDTLATFVLWLPNSPHLTLLFCGQRRDYLPVRTVGGVQ